MSELHQLMKPTLNSPISRRRFLAATGAAIAAPTIIPASALGRADATAPSERITIGGVELAGADIPNAQPMRSAYLTLGVDSDAEAQRIVAALADGGEVFMPLQETFWAQRFGILVDQFGIPWMINVESAT